MAQTYPSSADYISAIENSQKFLLDPVLKTGRPRESSDGSLVFHSGSFARVFVIDCGGKAYALRCWTSGIGDAESRYRAVSSCLRQARLQYFVEFEYVPKGILVNGEVYPIVRMEWVKGLSLREFIKANLFNSQILRAAADNFLAMAQTLHSQQIAHGDLQSDNLKLRMNGAGPEFLLIDYDTLVVPSLAGTKPSSTGIAAYQHPARKRASMATAKDDYFAELVIYLTLYALADRPELWHEHHLELRDTELIFSSDDFESAVPTARFHQLRCLSPLVKKLTLVLWNYTRCRDIQWLIPIEEVVRICHASTASAGTFEDILYRKSSAANSTGWLYEWSAGDRASPTIRPSVAINSSQNSPVERDNVVQIQANSSPFRRSIRSFFDSYCLNLLSDLREAFSSVNFVGPTTMIIGAVLTLIAWLLSHKGYHDFGEFWNAFSPWGIVRVVAAGFVGMYMGWAVCFSWILLFSLFVFGIGVILVPFYVFIESGPRDTEWPETAAAVVCFCVNVALTLATLGAIWYFLNAFWHGEVWSRRFFDFWWEGTGLPGAAVRISSSGFS